MPLNLSSISALRTALLAGRITPREVVEQVLQRCRQSPHENVWITRASEADLLARAQELERLRPRAAELPLYGVPFAVKDNIDVAAMPTTAACPAYARVAERHATVVRKLLDAGAICAGKTNMDQFATGLVGTRSPYGACRSVYHRDYISGGSSSGSAVAVAGGMVTFSLGTDTAGSGRVPAAFNGIVGLKPTRGRISTCGVVPACRSLDCVSIFARSVEDAQAVLAVAEGFDPDDPYSRAAPGSRGIGRSFRFGVPHPRQRRFFGDGAAEDAYGQSIRRMQAAGGQAIEIDYAPLDETAQLLYGGPWVAERAAAVGEFIAAHPDEVHPVVRAIIEGAGTFAAADVFRAQDTLAALRRRCQAMWEQVDCLLLPTAGTIYRVEQVLADPLTLNAHLGYYTNFVNLLDLSAVAIPAGVRGDGLPFGVTLIAPAWQEVALCALAGRFASGAPAEYTPGEREVLLAVVGAHLSGMPLNHQLTRLGARLARACRTAPRYRLYALANTTPPKPGLVRAEDDEPGGAAIAIEVWALDRAALGAFVSDVPPPLAIGSIELEDGVWVKGFVCEPRATAGARDITHHGGWRPYIASLAGHAADGSVAS